MFTVQQIEERYGVSEGTVLGWIARGELKAVNVGRTANAKKPRWRISAQAVEEFERGRTPASVPVGTSQSKVRKKKQGDVVEFYK